MMSWVGFVQSDHSLTIFCPPPSHYIHTLQLNRLAAKTAAAASTTQPLPLLPLGTVVRHARHGYRGVVIASHPWCQAGAAWVKASGADRAPHGLSQPFYTVLVDVRDRPCQVSYIAGDWATPDTSGDGEVLHPLMARNFAGKAQTGGLGYVSYCPTAVSAADDDAGDGGSSPGPRRNLRH